MDGSDTHAPSQPRRLRPSMRPNSTRTKTHPSSAIRHATLSQSAPSDTKTHPSEPGRHSAAYVLDIPTATRHRQPFNGFPAFESPASSSPQQAEATVRSAKGDPLPATQLLGGHRFFVIASTQPSQFPWPTAQDASQPVVTMSFVYVAPSMETSPISTPPFETAISVASTDFILPETTSRTQIPPPSTLQTSPTPVPTRAVTSDVPPSPTLMEGPNKPEQGNRTVPIAVGTVCGSLILFLLAIYAIMHWRKRRPSVNEEEPSSFIDPKHDTWRASGGLRRYTSCSNTNTATPDSVEREKMQTTTSLSWVDWVQSTGIVPGAARRWFGVLKKSSRVMQETEISEEAETQGRPASRNSRSVFPLADFDTGQPHATHEEDGRVSPPSSSERNPMRHLAPGQKYWPGFGTNASHEN